MKTIATVLLLTVSALACRAQADSPAVVITTNLVTADANFRQVNGRLYNTKFSMSWSDMDGIVTDLSDDGGVLVSNTETGYLFILRNYADLNAVGVGVSAKALLVGTNDWFGKSGGKYPTYDCGQPYRVLVVTTNRIPPATVAPGIPRAPGQPNPPVIIRMRDS